LGAQLSGMETTPENIWHRKARESISTTATKMLWMYKDLSCKEKLIKRSLTTKKQLAE